MVVDFIDKIKDLLLIKSKEKKEFDAKIDRNDAFILQLLDELAKTKPLIEKRGHDYHLYLKGFKVIVSSFSYIYVLGFNLEYSSESVRSSFGMAVRTIYDLQ